MKEPLVSVGKNADAFAICINRRLCPDKDTAREMMLAGFEAWWEKIARGEDASM